MKTPDSFRHGGRTYKVRETMHIGRRRLLIVDRLSAGRFARFKAIDPTASPGGELRTVHRLPDSGSTMKEIRLMSRIHRASDNVPTILEWRRKDGEVLVLTNWIYGNSLREELNFARRCGEQIAVEQAVRLFRGLVHGLSSLHYNTAMGHGDVKPENLIVTPKRSRLVMIDFGNAWAMERAAEEGIQSRFSPPYAAPEIRNGEKATLLSDQYSATVVFFEMLTGVLPPDEISAGWGTRIWGNTAVSPAIAKLQAERYFPPRTWRQLNGLIRRGLAAKSNDRFTERREWLNAVNNLWSDISRSPEPSRGQIVIEKLVQTVAGFRRTK